MNEILHEKIYQITAVKLTPPCLCSHSDVNRKTLLDTEQGLRDPFFHPSSSTYQLACYCVVLRAIAPGRCLSVLG